jgi:hypothetical protein
MKFSLGTPRQLKFSDHGPVIDTVDLTNRHRKTGIARQYAEDNIANMLSGVDTKERMRHKQMYGYVGHTFYKHGFFSDEVEPSHVCTDIKLDWPYLQHTEKFLANDKGKIAEGLYDSGTHGFSWAIGGKDGGEFFPTKAAFIQGFDLVGTESFVSLEKKQMIDALGESLTGFAPDQIDAIGESVYHGCNQTSAENIMFEAQSKINELQFDLEVAQLGQVDTRKRAEMIGEAFSGKNFPLHIPNEIVAILANPGDKEQCDKVAEFFIRASGLNTSQLPTAANLSQGRLVIEKKVDNSQPDTVKHPIDAVFDSMPDNLM